MGCFDNIDVADTDSRFFCSEGHPLDELQSKSFGETMGTVFIRGDEVKVEPGFGPQAYRMLEGRFSCYGSCERCPALLLPTACGEVETPWVEFEVTMSDGKITEVQRVSPSTAEWLTKRPNGADGPLPYKEAIEMYRRRLLGTP